MGIQIHFIWIRILKFVLIWIRIQAFSHTEVTGGGTVLKHFVQFWRKKYQCSICPGASSRHLPVQADSRAREPLPQLHLDEAPGAGHPPLHRQARDAPRPRLLSQPLRLLQVGPQHLHTAHSVNVKQWPAIRIINSLKSRGRNLHCTLPIHCTLYSRGGWNTVLCFAHINPAVGTLTIIMEDKKIPQFFHWRSLISVRCPFKNNIFKDSQKTPLKFVLLTL